MPVRMASGMPEIGMPVVLDKTSARVNPAVAVAAESTTPGRNEEACTEAVVLLLLAVFDFSCSFFSEMGVVEK
jgi:hypothetical protein